METVKLGVAGVGHFGRYHALKAASASRAQLVGVYDLNPERARAVGWEAGAPPLPLEELIAAADAIIVRSARRGALSGWRWPPCAPGVMC